jgi:GMP synthase (glutamine-hydrolysing)
MFIDNLHLPVTVVDASEATLAKLKGVSDPEAKRKIIGAEFINVFKQFKQTVQEKVRPYSPSALSGVSSSCRSKPS